MTKLIKTAADLAALYNALTGKNLKPTSYSKSKWEALVEEARRIRRQTQPVSTDHKALKALANGEASDTFTLAKLARELGINPKMARARYRKVENDKVRTQYIFIRTKEEIERVTKIISK